jgi:pimeloyl-ACP methyl ester carboxylesterase
MDGLGLRGVPFAGHSAGATAGLYLASEQPQYFSRLAAVEPIVMPGGYTPDEEQRDRMAEGARRRRMVFGSSEEMVEQYRARPTFERWPDDMLRLYAEQGVFTREDGSIELKCPGEIEGEIFSNSGVLNVWDRLPHIAAPVLVLKGELTEGFLSMVADGVAARVPNGRLVTLPGLGHLAPMESPKLVADELLGWL